MVGTKQNLTFIKKLIGESGMVDLEKSFRESRNGLTVKGPGFAYFSLAGVLGEYSLKKTHTVSGRIHVYQVNNEKESTVGYLVIYKQLPDLKIDWNVMGVSLFYTKERVEYHSVPKVIFSDKRFRLIAIGRTDYFCSVKWKSANPEEEG